MTTANGRDRSVSASARTAPTRAPESDTTVGTDTNHMHAAYPSSRDLTRRWRRTPRVRLRPMSGERFSAELWSGIEQIYQAILAHPFLTGLVDGSLERESFQFYVIQDAHYLREYARALSVAAARAPTGRDIAMLARYAEGAVAIERSLHESFFCDFALSGEDIAPAPLAPTNVAYTSHLLATAHGGSRRDARRP